VSAVGAPFETSDGGSVVDPIGDLELVVLPDEDTSVLVTRGDVSAIRGVVNFGGCVSVALKDGFSAERGSVELVDVDVLVITANSNFGFIGGESKALWGVGDVLGVNNLAILDEEDLLLKGTSEGKAASARSNSQTERLTAEQDLLTSEVGSSASYTEGIINGHGEHVITLELESDDGVLVAITTNLVVDTAVSVPPGNDGVVAASVEGVCGPVVSNAVDGFVVTLDNPDVGPGVALVEVDQVTTEREGNKVLSLPQATNLHVLNGGTELEGSYGLTSGDVPDFAGLVTRASEDLSTIGGPAGNVDTTLVSTIEIEGSPLGASLAIVEETGLVLSNGNEEAAIRAVPDAIDEVAVIGSCGGPLEGRALMPRDGKVLTTSYNAERLSGPVVASSDGLGVASNGTPTRASLSIEDVSHLFLAVTNNNYLLAVRRPSHIKNGTTKSSLLKTELEDSILNNFSVPDTDSTSVISRGNEFAIRAVSGNGGGPSVFSVNFGDGRIIKTSDDNVVAEAVNDLVEVGRRTTKKSRFTTSYSRERSEQMFAEFDVVAKLGGFLSSVLSDGSGGSSGSEPFLLLGLFGGSFGFSLFPLLLLQLLLVLEHTLYPVCHLCSTCSSFF